MLRAFVVCALLLATVGTSASVEEQWWRWGRKKGPRGQAADTTDPVVTITSPTSSATYNTSSGTINLSGTATDAVGVSSCSWVSDNSGSGSATGTTSWSVSSIDLAEDDDTVITVTCVDAAANEGTDTITVTHTTGSEELEADTVTADCERTTVQNAINAVTDSNDDGYTVVEIAAGTCDWSAQLTWTAPADAVLRGQGDDTLGGGDVTVIVDDFATSSSLMAITTNASGSFRMHGLTIQGGSGVLKNNRIVFIGGATKELRIDHNTIDSTTYSPGVNIGAIRIDGHINGVVDNNIFEGYQGVDMRMPNYPVGSDTSNGDGSWATATNFGGSDAIFIEDNTFVEQQFGGANDCSHGARFVFRYNETGKGTQNHTTGGSGRARGCRSSEIYRNNFERPNTTGSHNAFFHAVGPALIWDNTMPSGFNNFVTLHAQRKNNATYNFDTNPPSGWGHCGTEFNGTGSNWDGNDTATYGYPCLDQIGRGVGDLMSGGNFPNNVNNTTGTVAWLNQALEPVYEWGNVVTLRSGGGGAYWSNGAGEDRFQANRDYYLGLAVQTTSSSPFDGTTGMGVGTIANRPTTCTATTVGAFTAGVAYWATDEGEWDSTNGATADGKMYICTATNTWNARYGMGGNTTGLPYTYPHPLRGGS
jgi:hypothetical protein